MKVGTFTLFAQFTFNFTFNILLPTVTWVNQVMGRLWQDHVMMIYVFYMHNGNAVR